MSDTPRDSGTGTDGASLVDKAKPRQKPRNVVTPLQSEVGRLSLAERAAGRRPVAYQVIRKAGGEHQTARKPKENGLALHVCERKYLSTLPPGDPTLESIERKSLVIWDKALDDPDVPVVVKLQAGAQAVKLNREHGSGDGEPNAFRPAPPSMAIQYELRAVHAHATGIELALSHPDAARERLERLGERQADLRERLSRAKAYEAAGMRTPRAESRRRLGLPLAEAED